MKANGFQKWREKNEKKVNLQFQAMGPVYSIAEAKIIIPDKGTYIGYGLSRRVMADKKNLPIRAQEIAVGRALKAIYLAIEKPEKRIGHLLMGIYHLEKEVKFERVGTGIVGAPEIIKPPENLTGITSADQVQTTFPFPDTLRARFKEKRNDDSIQNK